MSNILVIGERTRSEFAPVRDWLRGVESAATVEFSPSLASPDEIVAGTNVAGTNVATAVCPDLVIVCQSWPDEFSPSEVAQTLGRWPLSLWVCCFGAWCASDGRSRSIWPISVRVPVDEAPRRLNHVWQLLAERRGEPLPLTASRDEAFEFDHCVDNHPTPSVAHP